MFIEKAITRLDSLTRARHSSGIGVAFRWYWERVRQNLGVPADSPWGARPRQVAFPLVVHRGETSDLRVFEQIFVLDEYACLRDLTNVDLVLDLGANVGLSAAYFLSVFPSARLLAVEPFQRNVDVLRTNLAPYGERAMVLHGAAWGTRSRVSLVEGAMEWAMQVEDADETGLAINRRHSTWSLC